MIERLKLNPHITLQLFLIQMKAIFKSKGAIIVLLGLTFLPSLYAWFNIAASWDPYGLTCNLKVAVTNNDVGTDIKGIPLNVGKQIEDKLKANQQFNWQFVDKDEAISGVHSGKYYAAISIPKSFSQDLTSFLTKDLKKPSISYYVNEKVNAISPKVTETGMNALEHQVNEAFVHELSKVVLSGLKLFDEKYQTYRPSLLRMLDGMDLASQDIGYFIEDLNDVKHLVGQIDDFSSTARKTLPQLNDSIKNAQGLTQQAQSSLLQGKESLNLVNRLIDSEINSLPVQTDAINADVTQLLNATNMSANAIANRLNDQSERLHNLSRQVNRIHRNIDRLNDFLPIPSSILRDFSTRLGVTEERIQNNCAMLEQVSSGLKSGQTNIDNAKESVFSIIDSVQSDLESLSHDYNTNVRVETDKLIDELMKGLDSTYRLLSDASSLLPKMDQLLVANEKITPTSLNNLNRMQDTLGRLKDGLSTTNANIRTLTDDQKISEVLNLIQKDIGKQSDFLSHPVHVDKKELYKMPNYGSAMTPFYTVLALWVGCLLLVSIIHPVNTKGLVRYPKARLSEMYLSRLALYLCIAAGQSIIISLGNLCILGVSCVYPILYVLYSICIALIFAVFIFSLVFTFGNVGKAIAIIILVLQVAASGGTYPAEMTPAFFQIIHPILPFTYAIGGMREVLCGIYWPTFIHQNLVLSTIPILSVLMVLLLGPYLRRWMIRFEHSMEKSGLN